MKEAPKAKDVAREIDRSYKRNRKLVRDAMREITQGTHAFLQHVKVLSELERDWRDERSKRGLDAQNLGHATTTRYEFVATVLEESLQPKRSAKDQQLIEEL